MDKKGFFCMSLEAHFSLPILMSWRLIAEDAAATSLADALAVFFILVKGNTSLSCACALWPKDACRNQSPKDFCWDRGYGYHFYLFGLFIEKKIDNHEIAKMINFTLYKLLVKGDMKLHQEANNRWNYFGHAVCHSIKANAAGCDK